MAQGHEVTVLTKQFDCSSEVDEQLPCRVIRSGAKRDLLFSFWAAKWLLKQQVREKFDIVHVHGFEGLLVGWARKTVPRRIPPIVLSIHTLRRYQFEQYRKYGASTSCRRVQGMLSEEESKALLRGFNTVERRSLIMEPFLCNAVDMIVPVADYLAMEINRVYGIPGERIHPVLNGVRVREPSNQSADIRKRLLIDKGTQLILYVGRMELTKGCHDLIAAFRLLKSHRKQAVKLLFIGTGGGLKALRALVERLGLSEDVVFMGHVPHNEVFSYYSVSDLFVLPSYSEGMPKVLLEAMASGCPTVVSDIDAHRSVIEPNVTGYLFRTGDVDNLASVIQSALCDEGREKIISKAKRTVRDNYTWEAVAKRLEIVYMRLLGLQCG